MSVTLVDPSLLGTDIRMVDDIDPVWGLATGFACLAQDLLHRLTTPRGGLFYDPAYGFSIVGMINQGFTPTELSRAQQDITDEVSKDPRVRRPKVKLTLNEQTNDLRIDVTCDTEAGPFSLVLAATDVTVQVLAVNGQAVASAPVPAASQPPPIVVIEGGGGAGAGIPGPPGPAGGPQASVTIPGFFTDDSGGETWQAEVEMPMGSLGSSLTVEAAANVRSSSGTATFRLRLGGGDETVDGSVILTLTSASASFEEKSDSAPLVNPNGLKRLKLTIQSSGAASAGEIKGVVVTFR